MYLRSGSKLGGLFIFAYFEGSEKVDDVKVTREVTTIFGKCQLQQQPTFMTNFLIASMKRGSLELNFFIAMCGWAFGRRWLIFVANSSMIKGQNSLETSSLTVPSSSSLYCASFTIWMKVQKHSFTGDPKKCLGIRKNPHFAKRNPFAEVENLNIHFSSQLLYSVDTFWRTHDDR